MFFFFSMITSFTSDIMIQITDGVRKIVTLYVVARWNVIWRFIIWDGGWLIGKVALTIDLNCVCQRSSNFEQKEMTNSWQHCHWWRNFLISISLGPWKDLFYVLFLTTTRSLLSSLFSRFFLLNKGVNFSFCKTTLVAFILFYQHNIIFKNGIKLIKG